MVRTKTRRTRRLVQGAMILVASAGLAWGQRTDSAPATATAPTLPPDPTAILKAIPADASGFMVFRNLREMSGDIVRLGVVMGLPIGPGGLFPAPLDWLKESYGLRQGLDETGSLAFVLTNASQVQNVDDLGGRMAIFLPVSDARALLEAMGASRNGDLWTVTVPNLEGAMVDYVAAPKGRFLVLSESPDVLRSALNTAGGDVLKTMSPDRAEACAARDLFIWGHLGSLSPTVRTALRQRVAERAADYWERGGVGFPQPETLQGVIRNHPGLSEASREVSVGIAVDRRGLSFSFSFRVDPASALGAQMKATPAAAVPLLVGLPDEATVLAFDTVVGPRERPWLAGLVDGLLSRTGLTGRLQPEAMSSIKEGINRLLARLVRVDLSVAGVPPEAKLGLANLVMVAETDDSGQWIEQCRQVFEIARGGLRKPATQSAGAAPDAEPARTAADAVVWKAKAEEVAGVAVDRLSIDADALAAGPEDAQRLRSLGGPEGLVLRVAPADARRVLLVFGGGTARLGQVIASVRQNESPLGRGSLAGLSQRLPPGDRLREIHGHLDQALKLYAGTMNQMGRPLNLPFALRQAAPVPYAVNRLSDAAWEIHLLIPTELLLSLADARRQMYMGGEGQGMDMEMPAPGSSQK